MNDPVVAGLNINEWFDSDADATRSTTVMMNSDLMIMFVGVWGSESMWDGEND